MTSAKQTQVKNKISQIHLGDRILLQFKNMKFLTRPEKIQQINIHFNALFLNLEILVKKNKSQEKHIALQDEKILSLSNKNKQLQEDLLKLKQIGQPVANGTSAVAQVKKENQDKSQIDLFA